MTETAMWGMEGARLLYEHRGERARELAKQGREVIGYFCAYTPVEFLTALDLVPYRIHGGVGRPLEKVDEYLETIVCPYVRSAFDMALRGEYNFLSGVVIPHTCDAMHRLYDIWMYYIKPGYGHSITVPHMTHKASFEYFRNELATFRRSLERYAGRPIDNGRLREAIREHNRCRRLVRELYDLRKSQPPALSGTEAMWVLLNGTTIPVGEYNDLLESVIEEVRRRKPEPDDKPRLMFVGSEVDDASVIHHIEDCEANVVMDDLCTGSRHFWVDVDETKEPVEALAERYLGGRTCPCTYRSGIASERFGYLGEYARDWDIDGVLVYAIRFCDTYQLDAPEIQDYMQELKLPVLYLEDDYVKPALGQWRTRVEAFLETIEARKE